MTVAPGSAAMSDGVQTLRARIAELMPRARKELSELVAIPSVADPRQFPPQECARAAKWVADRFAGAGFGDVRLAETPDGSSAVIGSRPCGDPDAPTVLLLSTYDVQPPLDEQAWRSPPFRLTEVDDRWYGRGASDCKGNIVMHLMALRALGHEIPVHVKVVVEDSESKAPGARGVRPRARRPTQGRRHHRCRHGQRGAGPGHHREPARRSERRRDSGGAHLRGALGDIRRSRRCGVRRPRRHGGHAPGRTRQHNHPWSARHRGLDR